MKKTIMIDLDDTICSGGYLDIVNNYLKANYNEDDVDGYYFESLLPDGINQSYVDYFYSQDVYSFVKIFNDAKEVIKKLNEKYQVCICSAYVFSEGKNDSYIHLGNKYRFLVKEFPFLDPNNFIFTSRKDLIDCDIKIDDKISNLEGPGSIKILYTAYHNRKVDDSELKEKGIIRFSSWKEIGEYLLGD